MSSHESASDKEVNVKWIPAKEMNYQFSLVVQPSLVKLLLRDQVHFVQYSSNAESSGEEYKISMSTDAPQLGHFSTGLI
jgi:hypothetical protein